MSQVRRFRHDPASRSGPASDVPRAVDVLDEVQRARRNGHRPRPAGRASPAESPGEAALAPIDAAGAVDDDLWIVARSPYVRVVKPVIDIVGAAVLVVLLLPVLAAISVAVLVSMGRPVIFRQPRVTRGGDVFTVFKFRTMVGDRRRRSSSEYTGPERRQCHKRPDDPRVTPVGRFLRRSSLDELPQLVNVLRGEMSLVGPRPELVEIVRRYEPWQHNRHEVKPGITGLWQTCGRTERPMHEHVELDLDYVARVSLRTDLKILLKTIPVLVGKRWNF